MIAIALLVFLVVTGLVKYFLQMRHFESYVKHVKMGNRAFPFVGNAWSLIGKSTASLFKEITEVTKTHGTPLKGYMGPALVISLDRPDDIKTVLMSPNCLDKPYLYQFYPRPCGILNARSGTFWKPIRKLMNPSFNLKILQSFVPIFNEKAQYMLDKLDKQAGNANFDILPFMNALTLDMVCSTTMGFNINSRDGNGAFLHSIEAYFDIAAKRIMKFWTHLDFVYRWTDLYKKEQKHLENLFNLTNEICEAKKMQFVTENRLADHKIDENSEETYKTPQVLIDQLLELYFTGKLDDRIIRDQIETIVIAGNETTALSLSYITLLLAMYPNIQEKVFEELRSVFDSQEEEMTYEHIQRLPYLDRVIKEGMRVLPVVPFMMRTATADTQISDCIIPKDAFILMSIYNLHRRQDIWGDGAEEFNPDHFLPENMSKRHAFSFLPFSGGPRNCIGYQYGMISMKVALSSMLRRYKFTTDLKLSDLELKFELTLKISNKHMVGMERRAENSENIQNLESVSKFGVFRFKTMIVLTLIAILVVTGVVKHILRMRHWESYVKHLKIKSPVYPLFGNSLGLIGKTSTDLFYDIVEYIKENETPHKSYMGPFLVITIDRPEDFKSVLMSQYCLDKPYIYSFYPSKVSIMSATSSAIWKPIRKLMNPAFNLKTLQSFQPIFNEKIKILVENLDKQVGKSHFNLLPYMSGCTLDMISTTSMGYNLEVQRNKNREFAESLEAFFDIVAKRFINFWAHSDYIYRWTDLYKEQVKHLKNLRNLTTHIYHIKKAEFISQNKYKLMEENDSNDSYEKPQILIDRLLRLVYEGKIDEKIAIDEVETMLIGGTETSSSGASYVILLLAMYPDIQEKVYEELRSVYNSQDEDTTHEHTQQLSYMDRVIKEGLRLFPLGPFIIRHATGDVKVSNCTIPKDSYIALSIFTLHRRPDIWGESPDQFNPDNFLPENVMKRHAFSYVPFAGGPRNCIGYQYGMMSLRMMLSALLRRFKFITNLKQSELVMRFEITLKLCNGHMVGIERRVW
ncbi:cytochrome P450 4g1-like [Sitodiplosis mosellana]|uniref:cytochrome P450 4g1-like n=1 Tax=Sitodiplosis mosellana TaxID=263140 RepID=UPI002443FD19|nr:cytochrome P450 4g1-like [Sitodiplosis mosellana]